MRLFGFKRALVSWNRALLFALPPPLCFVSAVLLLKRRSAGYLLGTVYLVFLSLLMTALPAKIVAMGMVGANIIPAVFIIPAIRLVTIVSAFRMIRAVAADNP